MPMELVWVGAVLAAGIATLLYSVFSRGEAAAEQPGRAASPSAE